MRSHGWTGLRPAQVEDLVVAGSEVVLAPAADVYLDDDDDEPIGGSGFHLLDTSAHPARPARGRARLPGTIVTTVVRTEGFPHGLRDRRFDPGRRIKLLPEDNLSQRNSVAIWDERERVQAGYVPRCHARRVRRLLAEDKIVDARVIWQLRWLRSGERAGLQLLISRCPVRLATAEERQTDDDVPF